MNATNQKKILLRWCELRIYLTVTTRRPLLSPPHRAPRLVVGYVTVSMISYITLPHPLPHRRHHMRFVARDQARQNQRRDLDR
jgi:hypothetical protein